MNCREFFNGNVENTELCKVLQKEPLETQIEWESETASEHSPMPVSDDEQLVRYWINPIHFDVQTGILKPTAFDEATRYGLSVNRLKYVAIEDVRVVAQVRVDQWTHANSEKLARTLIGYSSFSASEVRATQTAAPLPLRRALGVYDTASLDDISHADVCQIAPDAQGGRSARFQMRELANSRMKRF
jgi:hypothetical protein